MKKLISYSNIIFTISIGIFIYGAYKIVTLRQMLPSGVCPIDDNRPILFVGIFFMILSIIISYIEDNRAKKKILD